MQHDFVSTKNKKDQYLTMQTRRQIIKAISLFVIGIPVFFTNLGMCIDIAWAKAKRILLPKSTPMEQLISKNPAKLDTRLLETTPMGEFDVMGQDIYDVDIENWRLTLTGDVTHPLTLNYEEILGLDTQERNVLLVCPGFFAYNAFWKGVSMPDLIQAAGLKSGSTHVKFSGPEGIQRKTKKFSIQEVMTNKVFIAYQVNGKPLPMRHGFPVRLIAEDHYGGKWVKYVNRIEIFKK